MGVSYRSAQTVFVDQAVEKGHPVSDGDCGFQESLGRVVSLDLSDDASLGRTDRLAERERERKGVVRIIN